MNLCRLNEVALAESIDYFTERPITRAMLCMSAVKLSDLRIYLYGSAYGASINYVIDDVTSYLL